MKCIQCKECKLTYDTREILNRCRICNGSLDIIMNYERIKIAIKSDRFKKEKISHWKYWAFYPVSFENRVSLGEGGTPLIKSEIFGKAFDELHFKIETTNPTGSFKDRGTTVEITRALELDVNSVCCASTGNMGVSVACYCSKAGIDCTVFLPKKTSKQKIDHIKVYGAKIFTVNGNYNDALKACEKFSKEKNVYMVGDFPFRGEGEKSIGFEIAEQFNFDPPEYIVCPMGNGTLIYSIYDAFKDFWNVGLITKVPKLVGIQAEGCNPIVRAFEKNLDYVPPLKRTNTLASAIDVPNPLDGVKALEAIRKTKGFAGSVSDKEMIKFREELSKSEGIFAELAATASLAGAMKFKEKLKGRVVCLITGSGWKDLEIK